MKIIISTGGSGGHIMPAMAVAERLRYLLPEAQIRFVGVRGGMEEEMLRRAGYQFVGLPGVSLVRAGVTNLLKAPFLLTAATVMAVMQLWKFRPDLVFGVGGYASGVMVALAALTGVPTVIHEQNMTPGRTNRIAAKLARRVLVSFAGSAARFPAGKATVVGNPVRHELTIAASCPRLNDSKGPTLLIIGGSQGARPLNRAAAAALPMLMQRVPGLRIIHQTGRYDYDEVTAAYSAAGFTRVDIAPFFDDMAPVYGQSTVALTRAGAGVLTELALFGIPSVVVPFPQAADDHQTANARAFVEESGCGVLRMQQDLTPEALADDLIALLDDPERCARMSPGGRLWARSSAASDIAQILIDMARRTTSASEA